MTSLQSNFPIESVASALPAIIEQVRARFDQAFAVPEKTVAFAANEFELMRAAFAGHRIQIAD